MDINDVVEHIANVDSAINLSSAQEVLGKFAALNNDVRIKKLVTAKRMWQIGKLLADNKSRLKIVDLARAFNIRRETLSIAKRVARTLDCDDSKFKRQYDDLGQPSWHTFVQYFRPIKKTKRVDRSDRAIFQEVDKLITSLSDPLKADEAAEVLNFLVRRIHNYMPPKYHLTDVYYLPYSECCCCGEYAPPAGTGYELKTVGKNIKYPVCQRCVDLKAEPDLLKVTQLYYAYAHKLEDVVDKMNEGI